MHMLDLAKLLDHACQLHAVMIQGDPSYEAFVHVHPESITTSIVGNLSFTVVVATCAQTAGACTTWCVPIVT